MVREYVAELNRSYGDNIRTAAQRLRRRGIDADVMPHKTTIAITRPHGMSWQEFTEHLLAAIDDRRGSMILFSRTTGNVFICSNTGNQRGVFVRH